MFDNSSMFFWDAFDYEKPSKAGSYIAWERGLSSWVHGVYAKPITNCAEWSFYFEVLFSDVQFMSGYQEVSGKYSLFESLERFEINESGEDVHLSTAFHLSIGEQLCSLSRKKSFPVLNESSIAREGLRLLHSFRSFQTLLERTEYQGQVALPCQENLFLNPLNQLFYRGLPLLPLANFADGRQSSNITFKRKNRFASPEELENKRLTEKTLCFHIGIVLYQLLFRASPPQEKLTCPTEVPFVLEMRSSEGFLHRKSIFQASDFEVESFWHGRESHQLPKRHLDFEKIEKRLKKKGSSLAHIIQSCLQKDAEARIPLDELANNLKSLQAIHDKETISELDQSIGLLRKRTTRKDAAFGLMSVSAKDRDALFQYLEFHFDDVPTKAEKKKKKNSFMDWLLLPFAAISGSYKGSEHTEIASLGKQDHVLLRYLVEGDANIMEVEGAVHRFPQNLASGKHHRSLEGVTFRPPSLGVPSNNQGIQSYVRNDLSYFLRSVESRRPLQGRIGRVAPGYFGIQDAEQRRYELPIREELPEDECGMEWDELVPIDGEPKQRYCSVCEMNVHKVENIGEFQEMRGNCIMVKLAKYRGELAKK